MVSVPLRVAPVLASKLYLTTALPEPLVLPAVTCRNELLLEAVQAPVAASTTQSLPDAGPSTAKLVPRVAGARRSSRASTANRDRWGTLRARRVESRRGWVTD